MSIPHNSYLVVKRCPVTVTNISLPVLTETLREKFKFLIKTFIKSAIFYFKNLNIKSYEKGSRSCRLIQTVQVWFVQPSQLHVAISTHSSKKDP